MRVDDTPQPVLIAKEIMLCLGDIADRYDAEQVTRGVLTAIVHTYSKLKPKQREELVRRVKACIEDVEAREKPKTKPRTKYRRL